MRRVNKILQLTALLAVGAFGAEEGLRALPADSGRGAIPARVGHVGLDCSLFPLTLALSPEERE
jgi:hypothetical protein